MATLNALDKTEIAVLVPIKDFRHAKNRLSERLNATERESLARTMARQVLAAAEDLSIHVVCDSDEVASWAKSEGAGVIPVTQQGLNAAITEAMSQIASNFSHAIIVHADLPHARSLSGIAKLDTVSIVPDRHGQGTNVLSLPTGTSFKFQYGEGSLFSHMNEAISQGLDLKVLQIPELQWDVDTPEDLDGLVEASETD
ncbi:MAG TPA: 2-phospho-L-lactate guanylyltransferase [Acidimicrobiaceae bacterium]|nr:2-phospho-L-lactate guanylyltransferase [Acidimicrobiaceae bacterium]HAX05261.1 2-phospho-L-lactate guanylyltransferase [Acidimicrobiaceae bacterium]